MLRGESILPYPVWGGSCPYQGKLVISCKKQGQKHNFAKKNRGVRRQPYFCPLEENREEKELGKLELNLLKKSIVGMEIKCKFHNSPPTNDLPTNNSDFFSRFVSEMSWLCTAKFRPLGDMVRKKEKDEW